MVFAQVDADQVDNDIDRVLESPNVAAVVLAMDEPYPFSTISGGVHIQYIRCEAL